MEWYYIVLICFLWAWLGKGCEVLAKDSPNLDTDHNANILILFLWPLILIIASFELGKDT